MVSALRAAGCVFAEEEAGLLLGAARGPAELDAMVARRTAGHPLEHVVGWARFGGLRVAVDEGVFVPRRRTEFLVERATALVRGRARPLVVDLCCGTGALGAALVTALGGAAGLHAADIDPAAVRCARRNVAPLGGLVHEGNLFDALPPALRGRVDVLLANVPYVPTAEVALLPAEARVHEARIALDGGADGLDVLRRVVREAGRWLAPGGSLLFETGSGQAPAAARIAEASGGLAARVETCEERYATVVVATRHPHPGRARRDDHPHPGRAPHGPGTDRPAAVSRQPHQPHPA
ncbi:Release factor glutamine methyltransferase [Streptomyces sp. enrichment culture]